MECNKGFEGEDQTQSRIHFSKITKTEQFHGIEWKYKQSGDYCQSSYVYLFAQLVFEMGPSVSQICLAWNFHVAKDDLEQDPDLMSVPPARVHEGITGVHHQAWPLPWQTPPAVWKVLFVNISGNPRCTLTFWHWVEFCRLGIAIPSLLQAGTCLDSKYNP